MFLKIAELVTNSVDPDEIIIVFWVIWSGSYTVLHSASGYTWQTVSLFLSLQKHAYSNILKILQPKKKKRKFSYKNILIFFIFLLKTQIVGTH